jgi:hypothetical protein
MLTPERMPINRLSADSDGLPELQPVSLSAPRLKLSFESDITEAGSVYDPDTLPNHRVLIKPTTKHRSNSNIRHSPSPERIITTPSVSKVTASDRTKTSSSNTKALRRSSAIYKRRQSTDVTENNSSIKSDKSTLDDPEDRDSGFHEDFDEALRSKQPSPDKNLLNGKTRNKASNSPQPISTSSERSSIAITPERAPFIPSQSRIAPVTLVDRGVTKKRVKMSLPEIEKTEKFKETFSTNLFENTILPDPQKTRFLGIKPTASTAKGKVVTPAEFEKLRQQVDDDSDDEEEEEDIARDETYQVDLAKQRRRQQAALSVYRQQMTKVVGADASPVITPQRLSQIGDIPEAEDESEEIPLAILMAHGFPQTNNRPSSSSRPSTGSPRERGISLDPKLRSPSPGNLPVFAKHLPVDPHARGLPRSSSSYDLRPSTRASLGPITIERTNSTPAIPLIDSYQSRQRKGALFLDPNQPVETPNQIMSQDQGYFNRPATQYEMMGMQPIHNQGMIQYVPVVVTPGSSTLQPMQPQTLMQELYDRQQLGVQQRQLNRVSQYALQYPPQQQPVMINSNHSLPQIPVTRPQSVFQDPRRSFYDQKSIYSSSSQQPTARPKLPSPNPAYRHSAASTSGAQPGRYRASTYAGAGLDLSDSASPRVPPILPDNDDPGWESLRRKKEEMQARRMTRMQFAA